MRGRILAGIAAALAAVLLIGAWQLGLLTPEPEEVNLADAVSAETGSEDDEETEEEAAIAAEADAAVAEAEEAAEDEATTTTAAPATTAAADEISAPCSHDAPVAAEAATALADLTELDGTWTVRKSDSTFAGYRIDEILSGANFTAVGRTSGVSGSITIDGASVTAADIAVDLVGLTSDSRIRDEQLKKQALQTSKFPTGCFTLSSPITIAELPVGSTTFASEADGTLHIHGVDQPVTISIESTSSEGLLFVIGSIDLALSDFDIEKPSAPAVADVSDTAVMEFSLVLSQ